MLTNISNLKNKDLRGSERSEPSLFSLDAERGRDSYVAQLDLRVWDAQYGNFLITSDDKFSQKQTPVS